MEDQVYMLVGDDYAPFAKPPSVLTLARLEALLQEGPNLQGARVVLGQGLDVASLPDLTGRLAGQGVVDVQAPGPRAPLQLTHKRHPRHVLVSSPEQLGPACYGFDLIVDGTMDRLSDHVTGQHMGAMLLVEAARQATIVTIECHCPRSDGASWGLVLQSMGCRFDSYAFPVPTRLSVNISESGHGDSQRAVMLSIEFLQAGHTVSCIELNVGLYRPDLLARLEGRRATQAAAEAVSRRMPRNDVHADLVP